MNFNKQVAFGVTFFLTLVFPQISRWSLDFIFYIPKKFKWDFFRITFSLYVNLVCINIFLICLPTPFIYTNLHLLLLVNFSKTFLYGVGRWALYLIWWYCSKDAHPSAAGDQVPTVTKQTNVQSWGSMCVCVCPSSIYFLRFSSSPALYPFSPFLFNNIKLSFFQQPESWITFKLWIQTFLMLRILTIEISSTCIKISSTCPVSSIRPSTAILC